MAEKSIKNGANDNSNNKNQNGNTSNWIAPYGYRLVFWMLAALFVLLVLLIVLPLFADKDKGFIEYSKWLLPALLGAFGAWIGAGAAYFLGKENLELSNKSTQDALETQQKMAKMDPSRMSLKNCNLTALNTDFIFNTNTKIEDVENKLKENVDYWFVPILENGKMKDVLHTEALWRFKLKEIKEDKKTEKEKEIEDRLSHVIIYVDTDKDIKNKADKLHGFFREFVMDDTVEYALKTLNKYNASVGIVCNELGVPSHCFSRKNLRSFILGGI